MRHNLRQMIKEKYSIKGQVLMVKTQITVQKMQFSQEIKLLPLFTVFLLPSKLDFFQT